MGENIYAYADTVDYGHAGFAIDWGTTSNGIQDPAGHRDNLLDSRFAEIGISIVSHTSTGVNDVGPLVMTQDIGDRSNRTQPFLLGVVYDDTDGKNFYSIGEGMAGVGVTVDGTNGTTGHYTTTTMTAGGYQLSLPAGTYQVTFSGGGLVSNIVYTNVVVTSSNYKLDAQVDPPVAANQPPTVGLLYPAAPSAVQGNNITLKASDVVDRDGTITRVEFYRDANGNGLLDTGTDQFLGLGTTDPVGWQWTGSTAGFPTGTNTFLVRVRDDALAFSSARSGTATLTAAPVIALEGNGQSIAAGSTSTAAANGTDLGNVDVYQSTATQTYTIRDVGGSALTLTGSPKVQISGAAAGDFSIVVQPGATVGANSSLTFQVRFDPTRIGPRQATITIASNDANHPSYSFNIVGRGDTAFFDEKMYLRLNADVAGSVGAGKAWATGKDHFLAHGYLEGRRFSLYYEESFYLAMNPGVAANVGAGKAWATGLDHFLNYGLAEGRVFGPYFDEAYYLAMNPDVASNVGVGKPWRRGIEHFLAAGQNEKRLFTPFFNAALYLLRNPDVAANAGLGKPWRNGFEHFVTYGQYEGRTFSLFYSEAVYRNANPDVVATIGTGPGKYWRSGLQHFLMFGQFEEGRVFSSWFDRTYYLAQNPSISSSIGAGKTYRTAFLHLAITGQLQGLRFVSTYDEAYYLAHNTDVAANVGPGKAYRTGFEHYILYGQGEGRVAVAPG
ncbi:MAG: choice-of-anchor D domain-containing protein [Planctomycetota bacterium]|nr:choice-of-anchor D domain-containing protein [Planctomycetota bacterium]